MRKTKKITSMLLVLCMLMAFVPNVIVSAEVTGTISLPASIENGSMTVTKDSVALSDGDNVATGDTLVFTVTPAEGYAQISGIKSGEVTLTDEDFTDTVYAPETPAFILFDFDTVDGVYQITSADDMKTLSNAVNSGFDTTDMSFALTNDISLTTADGFEPIGLQNKAFKGNFDGQNHTIALELTSDNQSDSLAVFGWIYGDITIQNIRTTGSVTATGNYSEAAGIVANRQSDYPNIINCHNEADVSGHQFAGGIGGEVSYSYIYNCTNSGTITLTGQGDTYSAGGIVADGMYVYNCLNTGAVTYTSESTVKCIGGIIGNFYYGELKNCVNAGTVKNGGGIIGYGKWADGKVGNNYYQADTAAYGVAYPQYTAATAETAGTTSVEKATLFTENGLGPLNAWASKNTPNDVTLLNWHVSGDVISLSSEAVDNLPYATTNNSRDYISVPAYNYAGDTVTVTSVIDNSYLVLTSVSVTDASGNAVTTTKNDDGTYTFTMPEGDVTVSAVIDLKLTKVDGVYQITSAEDMKLLSNALSDGFSVKGMSFALTNDISLTTADGFEPIGVWNKSEFNGSFDGQNHTIALELTSDESVARLAIFAVASENAIIKNIKTTGSVTATGENSYAAAVVGVWGDYTNPQIINCHNSASITCTFYAGGIAADPQQMKMYNCSNSGTITVTSAEGWAGGIAASNKYIFNCLNTGTVTYSIGDGETFNGYIGGIAGCANSGQVKNCVNTGAVTGGGAIVGNATSNNDTANEAIKEIENNYYASADGLLGIAKVVGTENTDDDDTKTKAVEKATLLTEEGLLPLNVWAKNNTQDNVALLGWMTDGSTVSLTSEEVTLPYNITNNASDYITVNAMAKGGTTVAVTTSIVNNISVTGITVTDANGSAIPVTKTETGYTFIMPESDVTISATTGINLTMVDGVYQITSADDMKVLSSVVSNGFDTIGMSFVLTQDIALTTEDGFVSVGTAEAVFKGTFDGGNHTVSLTINETGSNIGLFGKSSGTIKNVKTAGTVSGKFYVGAVVGYNTGTVENCHNSATVNGNNEYAGGIAGRNHGTIKNCSNSGAVSGAKYVGGITGAVEWNAKIINGLNNAAVTGGQYTGGIVGYASLSSLANCVNNGAVNKAEGSEYAVGGIAGKVENSGITITNCYYNQTVNSSVYDSGYDGSDNAVTTTDYAVSADDIISESVTDELNVYSYENSLLYWTAADGALAFTETKPALMYKITNGSEFLIVADRAKNGTSVEITIGEVPEYLNITSIEVDGEEITANEEGKYIFTMPEKDVIVNASAELKLEKVDEHNTYAINTSEELNMFAKAVNSGRYISAGAILTADVTASTENGFEPIGTQTNPYRGMFDANGHTIILDITEGTPYEYIAPMSLFSEASDEKIATGLFGVTFGAKIIDVVLKGTVDGGEGTEAYTGALIGVNDDDTYVYNLYSEAEVSGCGYVGGIVGYATDSIYLRNTINNGTVMQKNTAEDKKAVGAIMGIGNSYYDNVYYNSDKNSGMYDGGYDYNLNIVTDIRMDSAQTEEELFSEDMMDELNVYSMSSGYMFWDFVTENEVKTAKLVDKCPVALNLVYPANEMTSNCAYTDTSFAREGQTVCIETYPYDFEYRIKGIARITVTDSRGTEIEVRKAGRNKYEFTMPARDVKFKCIFEYDMTIGENGEFYISNVDDLLTFIRIVQWRRN